MVKLNTPITLSTWATVQPKFYPIVLRGVFVGPLLGGLPYVWMIFPIPFAYALGAGPALVSSVLFAWWLRAGSRPGGVHAGLAGAVCGGLGVLIAWVIWFGIKHIDADTHLLLLLPDALYDDMLRFLLPHGVFAGAILGAYAALRGYGSAKSGTKKHAAKKQTAKSTRQPMSKPRPKNVYGYEVY